MSIRTDIVRLVVITGAVLSVVGCASRPKPTPLEAAPPPPPPPAEAPPPPVSEQPTGPVPGSQQDFVINVGDRVLFDYNAFNVREDAAPILDHQAQWLQRYPQVQVRIEGNCDERGTREYNLALGERRANAVREYLMAHGISASRITTVSYGKERPVDPGTGDDAWAHNRNAHTALISGAQ